MPIIDFKEIPAGNKKGGVDLFETFACRFLERLGYTIEVGPAEGPDGGKDLIVSIDRRDGDGGSRSIRYIVSCKHAAHSGKSIGVSQEKSILDRIIEHKVDGFLAFYSTGLTVPLQTRFREFRNAGREIVEMTGNDIDEIVSDNLFALKDCLVRFFPESVARHMERLRVEDPAQFIEPIIAEFPEVEVVHNSHGRFIGLRSGSEEEEKTL